jgi:hypothetical protein
MSEQNAVYIKDPSTGMMVNMVAEANGSNQGLSLEIPSSTIVAERNDNGRFSNHSYKLKQVQDYSYIYFVNMDSQNHKEWTVTYVPKITPTYTHLDKGFFYYTDKLFDVDKYDVQQKIFDECLSDNKQTNDYCIVQCKKESIEARNSFSERLLEQNPQMAQSGQQAGLDANHQNMIAGRINKGDF